MLQRRMTVGETFPYRHPDTGEVTRVKIIEIRRGGEVIIGLEAAPGLEIALDPAVDAPAMPTSQTASQSGRPA